MHCTNCSAPVAAFSCVMWGVFLTLALPTNVSPFQNGGVA
jgi:hypothetical protein